VEAHDRTIPQAHPIVALASNTILRYLHLEIARAGSGERSLSFEWRVPSKTKKCAVADTSTFDAMCCVLWVGDVVRIQLARLGAVVGVRFKQPRSKQTASAKSSATQNSETSRIPLIVGLAVFLLAGCAAVDTLAPRGDTLNRTITDYRNEATLLNIIRASYNEPMNFVTLSTATGHGTLSASAGLASFTMGPGTPGLFGPNTATGSATDDFNVAALDDPQSYGALMTPLDLAMMGFFFSRHWPMELLLPIFVNYIRYIPPGQNKVYAFNTDDYDPTFIFCRLPDPHHPADSADCERTPHSVNEAEGRQKLEECAASPHRSRCISPVMILFSYLTQEGLVVQVPVGAIPGTQPPPPARICYDPVYNNYLGSKRFDVFLRDYFNLTQDDFFAFSHPGVLAMSPAPKQKNSKCDSSDAWIMPANFSQGGSSAQGGGTSSSFSNICINGACAASSARRAAANKQKYQATYEFYDINSRATIQIATRSTWAMYQYLGDLVRLRQRGLRVSLLETGFDQDTEVFKVVENELTSCFAWVGYSGSTYCVPKDAPNSKMILSLLHELANLYTKSSSAQQPNTGTVRVTP
jgi:hypothetical protein